MRGTLTTLELGRVLVRLDIALSSARTMKGFPSRRAAHNVMFASVEMRVHNPDGSPFAIDFAMKTGL